MHITKLSHSCYYTHSYFCTDNATCQFDCNQSIEPLLINESLQLSFDLYKLYLFHNVKTSEQTSSMNLINFIKLNNLIISSLQFKFQVLSFNNNQGNLIFNEYNLKDNLDQLFHSVRYLTVVKDGTGINATCSPIGPLFNRDNFNFQGELACLIPATPQFISDNSSLLVNDSGFLILPDFNIAEFKAKYDYFSSYGEKVLNTNVANLTCMDYSELNYNKGLEIYKSLMDKRLNHLVDDYLVPENPITELLKLIISQL